MKPGMFAVPATAVLPAQQGMITWVIGADNKVAPRVVMVERVVGQTAYLSDGVKPGERGRRSGPCSRNTPPCI